MSWNRRLGQDPPSLKADPALLDLITVWHQLPANDLLHNHADAIQRVLRISPFGIPDGHQDQLVAVLHDLCDVLHRELQQHSSAKSADDKSDEAAMANSRVAASLAGWSAIRDTPPRLRSEQMSSLIKKLLDLLPYDGQLVQAGREYCNQYRDGSPLPAHVLQVAAIVDDQKDHQVRQAQQLSYDAASPTTASQRVDYKSLEALPDIPSMLLNVDPLREAVKALPHVIVDHPIPSLEVHLDTQYKLLRCDVLMGVEEGLANVRRRFLHQEAAGDRSRSMRVYQGATCDGFHFTNEGGVLFRWKIPTDARNFRNRPRWERILMHGNFVVVTTPESLRYPDAPQAEFYRGTIFRRMLSADEIKNHVDFDCYIEKGEFDIAFDDQFDALAAARQDSYVLLETQTFAMPYFKVLRAIQSITPETLPRDIADALLTGRTRPPEYILAEPKLNFEGVLALKPNESPVVDILMENSLSNVCEKWSRELEDNGRLPNGTHCCDPTQLRALEHVFHHNVAIVQGTPGTGKTFVGAKVAQLLHNNFPHVRVLLLCFTNHALDSFLHDVLAVAPEARSDICRMGGRCSDDLRDLALHCPKVRTWDGEMVKEKTVELDAMVRRLALGHLNESDFMTLVHLKLLPEEMQDEVARQHCELTRVRTEKVDESRSLCLGIGELLKKIKLRPHADVNGKVGAAEVLSGICERRQFLSNDVARATHHQSSLQQEAAELDRYLYDVFPYRAEASLEDLLYEVRCEAAQLREYLQSGNVEQEESEAFQAEVGEIAEIECAISRRIAIDESIVTAQRAQTAAQQELESLAEIERLAMKLQSLKKDIDKLQAKLMVPPLELWRIEKGQYTMKAPPHETAPKVEATNTADQPLGDGEELGDADVGAYLADQELQQREVVAMNDEGDGGQGGEGVQFSLPPRNGPVSDEDLRRLLARANTAEDRETAYWMCVERLMQERVREIAEHCTVAQKAQEENRRSTAEEKASCLRDKWLIAATTTGGAANLDVIRLVKPTIVLVEEAAEVLESHVLACLTESVQHLILIGDHRQLQPKVQEQAIVRKNFQVSLMERFVRLGGSPFVTLTMQRRMHPDISDFTKAFYRRDEQPGDQVVFIEDHPSTASRPVPNGIEDHHRFWFVRCNGREKENQSLRSPYNTEEAELVVVMAQYLTMQDGVKPSSITILLPYTGQLFATFNVARQRNLPILSKNVPDGVKICTVDGFQGEENDYIIISLVRTEKPGFLVIDNRACVSLSRARCGMYLVGCDQILCQANPLWLEAVTRCAEHNALSEFFPAMCERHHTPLYFSCARDFDEKVNRQGGCQNLCKTKLPCGHECMQACHACDFDHSQARCTLPCERGHPVCGHRCTRKCYEECGVCEELVDYTCAHCQSTQKIPCWRRSQPPRCKNMYEGLLPCRHKISGPCWQWVCPDGLQDLQRQCKEPCTECMPCGHKCTQQCHYGSDDDHLAAVKKCRHLVTGPHPICKHPVEWPCQSFQFWKEHNSVEPIDPDIKYPRCNSVCGRVHECGHPCPERCWTCTQNHECAPCKYTTLKELPCKHNAEAPCAQDPATVICQRVCDVKLTTCEHRCGKRCCECKKELQRLPPWMVHSCMNQCGRLLPCRHKCIESCSKECPPCTNICAKTCPHRTCNDRQRGHTHTCSECTYTCRMDCEWRCEHYECHKKCGEPCDRPPCNQPCPKLRDCGHPCCGYCGEACPVFCPWCIEIDASSEASTDMLAKLCNLMTLYTTAQELCHAFTQSTAVGGDGNGEGGDEAVRLVQLPCGCVFLSCELDSALDAQLSASNGRTVVTALHCPSEACMETLYYYPRAPCVAKAWFDVREVQRRQRAGLVDAAKQLENIECELRSFAADFLDDATAQDLISRCDVEKLKAIRCDLREPKQPKAPRPPATFASRCRRGKGKQRARGEHNSAQDEYKRAQEEHKKQMELYSREKAMYEAAKAEYYARLEEARSAQTKIFEVAQRNMIAGGVPQPTAEYMMRLVSRLALGAPNCAADIRRLVLHSMLTRLCASALSLQSGDSKDERVAEACRPAEAMATELIKQLSSYDEQHDETDHLEAARVQLLRETFLQRWRVVEAIAPSSDKEVHDLCTAHINSIMEAPSCEHLLQGYDDKTLCGLEKNASTQRSPRVHSCKALRRQSGLKRATGTSARRATTT